ncbi:uncharacterized protein LOC143294573 [Babylonia areolata]|uniref:uncharacterized protein LOC143294573 n=1 Tax=Babylonia areolata TaxID=304850 RepID=UPI003FCFD2CD
MDGNVEKPDKKLSKREMKASSKSSSLPPGAVLMAHPGEGFFTKIRRCLRLRSKGKYDFSHSLRPPDYDSSNTPSSNSRSSNSPVTGEDGDNSNVSTKSSPLKAARRSKSDKEEVLLIRRDKRSSSGMGVTAKTAEGMRGDVLVVTIDDDRDVKDNEAAGAVSMNTENKEMDEVFEDLELDPDYETLDDIRRKVQSQVGNGTDMSAAQNSQVGGCPKTAARQPLQVKIKTSSDVSGQDSGLGSPFTDSPGSSRESQAQSVISSVFSSSVVSSNHSEPSKEPAVVVSTAVCTDGTFPQTADSDPMLTSTTSNCSNSALEEDDLYSNAKVLIRKKSQRQSQSQTSLSTLDQRCSGVCVDQPRSARNSLSPADFLAMMEAENPEPLAPPPLPARNYSEEDINAHTEKISTSNHSFGSDLKINGNGNPDSDEKLFNGTGARPKTSSSSSWRAASEHNPSIAVNSYQDSHITNGEQSHAHLSPSTDSPTPLAPIDNIYEDIPDRVCVKTSLRDENKPNDDLMCMDHDLATDGEHQSDRADSADLPEDIMIVSASDSCCGNETDDSQGNQLCSPAEESNVHFPVEPKSPETGSLGTWQEPAQDAAAADTHQEGSDMNCSAEGLPGTPETEPCSKSSFGDNADSSTDLHTTSLSPQNLSNSSSLVSSPSPASSSDTLNNLMDDPDPDDFEGTDLSPPVGPSIHISHQQLLRHLSPGARDSSSAAGREQGRGGAGARHARSMEIPPCHFVEQDGADATAASRRHSSSVPAARSHRDFLESMKQLKDCGWYWGPLSYEEAESKLIDKRDGSFLVRDSSNENYILSLSFKSMGQVHHTRIEHHKGLFSFWSQPDSHGKAQICQFIEQTVENSKNGRFLYFLRPAGPGSPPLPIQLLYPISRFFRVPSLQHMCRFLVLRRVRRDHIDFLPVPQKVKGYLLEKQYYVETLDED